MQGKSPQSELSLVNMLKIPVMDLKPSTTTDFDTYVLIENALVLYGASPYQWNQGELERLLKQGHTFLLYSNSDQAKVEAYQKICQMAQVDKLEEPSKRVLKLTEVGAELAKIVFEFSLSEAMVNKAKDISNMMVETIEEDRSCIASLENLSRHDYYTYFHSARVAAYAVAIALQQGITNGKELRELALGCLLHDIGKSKVDMKIINKPTQLLPKEWAQMKMHPVLGDEIASQTLLSWVPRSIILSHHERIDGKGYPHNLGKTELIHEVKIASFADVFDALTTNRSYQPSRSRYEALQFIRSQLMDGLDKDIFKAMIEILEAAQKKGIG